MDPTDLQPAAREQAIDKIAIRKANCRRFGNLMVSISDSELLFLWIGGSVCGTPPVLQKKKKRGDLGGGSTPNRPDHPNVSHCEKSLHTGLIIWDYDHGLEWN